MISKTKRMVELNLNEVQHLIVYHQAQLGAATREEVPETASWSTSRLKELCQIEAEMKAR